MKAEELFKIVEDRGLRIGIKDGQPVVSGQGGVLTPALIETLKAHRYEILSHLGLAIPKEPFGAKEQAIECMWPGNGYVSKFWFPDSGWPAGAYFYRQCGADEWIPIPGREWSEENKRGSNKGKQDRVNISEFLQGDV